MNTPVYLADIQAVKDKQKVKTVVRGHPREREAAATYILEMASGYFGWNEEAISRADAIEINPGLGGELPGTKVTAEIAAVRGISPGTAAHSPARFPDLDSIEQLRERISWIRSLDGGGDRPIGIKLAANHLGYCLRWVVNTTEPVIQENARWELPHKMRPCGPAWISRQDQSGWQTSFWG